MVGLSDAWSGVIQDTASTSTLVALICARERATELQPDARRAAGRSRGRSSSTRRRTATARSRRRRCSPASAARTCAWCRTTPTTRMRPDALREAIDADLRAGAEAVRRRRDRRHDHLHRVRSARRDRPRRAEPRLWLHVDAAMAGSAMILPECRQLWHGVERADSLVVNPHKWLGAAFDCTLYYVRDPEHLVRVMSTNPSYLQSRGRRPREELPRLGHPARPPLSRAEAVVPDPRAGRRAAAGAAAPRPRQRAVARRRSAGRRRLARARAGARCRPSASATSRAGVDGDALDRHTQAWTDRINRSGAAYLTPAILDGRWMTRVSIGAEPTERAPRRGAVADHAKEAER